MAKRRTSRRDELTELVRVKLETGFWFPEILEGAVLDDVDLKTAWAQHRDEVLAAHIAQHPFSRPWAWWQFDAPELRKRIKPGGPYSEYKRVAGFGIPANCYEQEFETERDYLLRLGLLTPGEVK